MITARTWHSFSTLAFTCLLLITSGCQRKADAALRERLVGTWRYTKSEGNKIDITSDLTFMVTTNGGYLSQVTLPQTHSAEGTAEIKNGYLIVTATRRDNTNVAPPFTEREKIISLDEKELVLKSEGSSLINHFQNLQRPPADDHSGPRL